MKEYKDPVNFTEADKAIYADIASCVEQAIQSIKEEGFSNNHDFEIGNKFPIDIAETVAISWVDAESIRKQIQPALVVIDGSRLAVEIAISAQRLSPPDNLFHWSVSDTVPPQREAMTPAIKHAILEASQLTTSDLTPYE